MAILSWIVFGLVIGFIAKLLMPGRDPGGFIVTILLGIAGALVGGFIGRAMGFYGPNLNNSRTVMDSYKNKRLRVIESCCHTTVSHHGGVRIERRHDTTDCSLP